MVRQYYVDAITDISEQELRPTCQIVEPPACLLGGWAVHLHVNDGFRTEYGREYIGSRDIDLGFHVDPTWNKEELGDAPVGVSVKRFEDHGYIPLSFRLVRHFHRETGEVLTESEAQGLPNHQVFDLFLDIIPDTDELETFRAAMGFRPPAEPLLRHVFENGAAAPLSDFVSWDVSGTVLIADPALLAAMKIRSIPDRDKDQKRVKDVADLHALLWYVREYREMLSAVQQWVSDRKLQEMQVHADEQVYMDAADLLQIDHQLVQDSIVQLAQ